MCTYSKPQQIRLDGELAACVAKNQIGSSKRRRGKCVLIGCEAHKQTVDAISKVQRSIELATVYAKAETANKIPKKPYVP